MSYRILYSSRAEKYLTRLISSKLNTILNRIEYVSLPRNQKALGVNPEMNEYSLRNDRENVLNVSSGLRGLNSFKQDNNIKKLLRTVSSYRLRVGETRVIYELNTQTKTMFVVKIAPRGSVYL